MATKPLPDQSLLLKLLRYDPETGKLYWRERTPEMFESCHISSEVMCLTWNRRYADHEASAGLSHGYPVLHILDTQYRSHRIIWKMVCGSDPQFIDHINGDRIDNRFCNLRQVDQTNNNRNMRLRRDNKSSATGVERRRGKWKAAITVNKTVHTLGYFHILDDAIRARKAAERKYGFHPNHGRKIK